MGFAKVIRSIVGVFSLKSKKNSKKIIKTYKPKQVPTTIKTPNVHIIISLFAGRGYKRHAIGSETDVRYSIPSSFGNTTVETFPEHNDSENYIDTSDVELASPSFTNTALQVLTAITPDETIVHDFALSLAPTSSVETTFDKNLDNRSLQVVEDMHVLKQDTVILNNVTAETAEFTEPIGSNIALPLPDSLSNSLAQHSQEFEDAIELSGIDQDSAIDSNFQDDGSSSDGQDISDIGGQNILSLTKVSDSVAAVPIAIPRRKQPLPDTPDPAPIIIRTNTKNQGSEEDRDGLFPDSQSAGDKRIFLLELDDRANVVDQQAEKAKKPEEEHEEILRTEIIPHRHVPRPALPPGLFFPWGPNNPVPIRLADFTATDYFLPTEVSDPIEYGQLSRLQQRWVMLEFVHKVPIFYICRDNLAANHLQQYPNHIVYVFDNFCGHWNCKVATCEHARLSSRDFLWPGLSAVVPELKRIREEYMRRVREQLERDDAAQRAAEQRAAEQSARENEVKDKMYAYTMARVKKVAIRMQEIKAEQKAKNHALPHNVSLTAAQEPKNNLALKDNFGLQLVPIDAPKVSRFAKFFPPQKEKNVIEQPSSRDSTTDGISFDRRDNMSPPFNPSPPRPPRPAFAVLTNTTPPPISRVLVQPNFEGSADLYDDDQGFLDAKHDQELIESNVEDSSHDYVEPEITGVAIQKELQGASGIFTSTPSSSEDHPDVLINREHFPVLNGEAHMVHLSNVYREEDVTQDKILASWRNNPDGQDADEPTRDYLLMPDNEYSRSGHEELPINVIKKLLDEREKVWVNGLTYAREDAAEEDDASEEEEGGEVQSEEGNEYEKEKMLSELEVVRAAKINSMWTPETIQKLATKLNIGHIVAAPPDRGYFAFDEMKSTF